MKDRRRPAHPVKEQTTRCDSCHLAVKCYGRLSVVALQDFLIKLGHLQPHDRTLVDAMASACRKWRAK